MAVIHLTRSLSILLCCSFLCLPVHALFLNLFIWQMKKKMENKSVEVGRLHSCTTLTRTDLITLSVLSLIIVRENLYNLVLLTSAWLARALFIPVSINFLIHSRIEGSDGGLWPDFVRKFLWPCVSDFTSMNQDTPCVFSCLYQTTFLIQISYYEPLLQAHKNLLCYLLSLRFHGRTNLWEFGTPFTVLAKLLW